MTKHQLEKQNDALRELLGNLHAILDDSLSELDDDDDDEEDEEDDDRQPRAKRK